MKSYRAAVYLRLSKEDRDLSTRVDKTESNSIANQKALILKKLDSMPEVTLYDIYIDDGYTGLNFERPQFQRMRNDIYEGRVNMVIVKDLSRLGRDYIDSGRYVQKIFPSLHVRFVSVLDRFDSLTASANDVNLMIPVKNFVNDNYSRDISAKVRSHQEVMRGNGLYVGAYVAYGYKKKAGNPNRIEPDACAADVVRHIFAWKLEGMSAGRIAEKLNRLGVAAPSEHKRRMGIHYKTGFQKKTGARWTAVSVTRILKNRIYTGVLEQGKREKINYKLDKVVAKPEQEWAVTADSHEAIISKTDFETVSRLLGTDMRKAPAAGNIYLFSGLLFCADCGRSMVRRQSKYRNHARASYICAAYNKGDGCSRHSISEHKVREIVFDCIARHREQIADADRILRMADTLEIKYEDSIANDREIHMKYEERNRCRSRKDCLCHDLAEGIIAKEEYIRFSGIYAERAKAAEQAAEELRQEAEAVFHRRTASNAWIGEFAHGGDIEGMGRSGLLTLIEKIVVHENSRIEIVLRYRDGYGADCENPSPHPDAEGGGDNAENSGPVRKAFV